MSTRNFSSTAIQTTLTSGVTAVGTVLAVAATTGFPAAPFILTLEPDTANQELVLVTGVAGLNLTVTRGYDSTTAVSHNAAAVVQHSHAALDFREANTHVNASTGVHGVAGAVVGTTDTQTLTGKTISADSNTISGIAASSFVLSNGSGNVDGSAAQKVIPAGVVLGTTDTQTLTNKTLSTGTKVGGATTDISGAMVAYTPTMAGWGLVNGTLTGKYMQTGKMVEFKIVYTVGSTDTFAGAPTFSLPQTAVALDSGRQPVGTSSMFDTSASAYRHYFAAALSTVAVTLYNNDGSFLSPTVPWTWAVGDKIVITGTYEAA
ncbi:MAG TPA: hypothetical protein VJW23_10215 [Propionibacteriaceae bacterium]|nr:hypothetical protein [Propionibacteriaceae bacterium]